MDWLFNYQIPSNDRHTVIIRPSGRTFVSGIAEEYEEDSYDSATLKDYISQKDFLYVIQSCNLSVQTYWPCDLAFYLGYLFAPFSFGLSLLLPNLCLVDAEKGIVDTVRRMNALKCQEKGLLLTYKKGVSTSWLELRIVKPKISIDIEMTFGGVKSKDFDSNSGAENVPFNSGGGSTDFQSTQRQLHSGKHLSVRSNQLLGFENKSADGGPHERIKADQGSQNFDRENFSEYADSHREHEPSSVLNQNISHRPASFNSARDHRKAQDMVQKYVELEEDGSLSESHADQD